MSDATENEINNKIDSILRSLPLLKLLFSGTFVIGSCVAGIAVWVFQVMDMTLANEEKVSTHSGKIESLERWQIRTDLDKFKVSDGVQLDKRLSNLEQSQEQIKTALKRIEERL